MKILNARGRLSMLGVTIALVALSGCASIPMATKEQDAAAKAFAAPQFDKVGIYVYRDSFVGQALRKIVSIDGKIVGASANKTYFFREFAPGDHTVSTESEFGDNSLVLQTIGGKNYFVRQYMKMGVFVGGAGVELVSDEDGKLAVAASERAASQ